MTRQELYNVPQEFRKLAISLLVLGTVAGASYYKIFKSAPPQKETSAQVVEAPRQPTHPSVIASTQKQKVYNYHGLVPGTRFDFWAHGNMQDILHLPGNEPTRAISGIAHVPGQTDDWLTNFYFDHLTLACSVSSNWCGYLSGDEPTDIDHAVRGHLYNAVVLNHKYQAPDGIWNDLLCVAVYNRGVYVGVYVVFPE